MSNVLVIDDSLVGLEQISSLISEEYDVALTRSGESALRVFETQIPDLILLDVEMPGMNGFEVLSRLKSNPDTSEVPVIVISAFNDDKNELRALEAGAVDFIAKPPIKNVLLHRIDLHIQLSKYRSSLENAVKEIENAIALSFADLIECKDKNVGGHVLRTSKYVEALGTHMLKKGMFPNLLDAAYLEKTVRATPFHDIGKVGVSDLLLGKPTKLSPQEYEQIKKHTEIGARIMDGIFQRNPELDYLFLAKEIAEAHHESWDGSGYPHGLKGEEIPLCARIMAVVNVYDACLTDRVYRSARTEEEALKIVSDGRGTMFDPRILDAFMEMYTELDVTLEREVRK